MTAADFLNWLGSHWGRQNHAIVCEACGWEDPTDTYEGKRCPMCGSEQLAVAVPNGFLLMLRWEVWKGNQKWLPRRLYVMGDGDPYGYIAWWGRKWRKRPWAGL